MLLIILLNFIYAIMFIVAKYAFAVSAPIFMTGARMTVGGIISLMVYRLIAYDNWFSTILNISKTQWILIGLLSLVNVYACNVLEVWGLQYLSVGKSAFIYNLGPFFAALLGYFIFHEQMTWKKWLGLIIGFVGFLPLLFDPCTIVDDSIKIGLVSIAEIALLGACISSVIGWTVMRLLLKQGNFSPFLLNGLSMTCGGVICFVHALFLESYPFVQSSSWSLFIFLVLIMAIFKHVIAYNLNAYLLQRYTATLMIFFSFTASLFATILGMVLFNESVSNFFLISIFMVFFGLILFYNQELQQGYIQK